MNTYSDLGPLKDKTNFAHETRVRNADEERAVAKCEKPVIRQTGREGDALGLGVRGGQRGERKKRQMR